MNKRQTILSLIKQKQTQVEELNSTIKSRNGSKKFTRKRNLWLGRLLTLILRCSPYSLQIRLDDYFKDIGHVEEVVSKQAFSKARTYLDPEIVRTSFVGTAEILSSCDDLELYRGKYRLCAIDGSDLVLDNADELLTHFGGSGGNKDCATALASICYDPLNDMILDGGLYPYGTSEREAAGKHFFEHNGKQYNVRVFKVTLETGEEEILVTNLKEKHLSRKEIGELYFKRWKIEVKLDSLKNKLELENMSGRRVVTTYQDFWAKLDLANTMAAVEYETNAVIEENNVNKTNQHKQLTNENRLITKFSQQYIEILSTENPDKRQALFDELVKDITRRPVEVKPDRFYERKLPRKKKYCDRRKRVLR